MNFLYRCGGFTTGIDSVSRKMPFRSTNQNKTVWVTRSPCNLGAVLKGSKVRAHECTISVTATVYHRSTKSIVLTPLHFDVAGCRFFTVPDALFIIFWLFLPLPPLSLSLSLVRSPFFDAGSLSSARPRPRPRFCLRSRSCF